MSYQPVLIVAFTNPEDEAARPVPIYIGPFVTEYLANQYIKTHKTELIRPNVLPLHSQFEGA